VTVTVDPTGRFAYAVDFASDQVVAFSIDQTSGALKALGHVVATGDEPYGMTVVAF
jgi:6-phosphogluconolactonase (cycloisomerase 2 family)